MNLKCLFYDYITGDLKPENILLVENEDFPHLKICDFGYSKVISDGSMRRTVVGTAAYSRKLYYLNHGYTHM